MVGKNHGVKKSWWKKSWWAKIMVGKNHGGKNHGGKNHGWQIPVPLINKGLLFKYAAMI